MSASENLLTFLKNTEKALRTHSVEELNDALSEVLKDKSDKKQEINFVLDLVANEYKTTRRSLVNSTARGNIQTAKKMAQCLLHFVLGLNTRYIAARIFNRWQNSISKSISYYKTLNLAVQPDKDFNDKYNKLEQIIIQKFKA